MKTIAIILKKLVQSKFRASFALSESELVYIEKVGLEKIESHARDFIEKRLSPASLANDGKQTPYKGHPVFRAQHATATCCRRCLEKWHSIAQFRELTPSEKEFIISLIMQWIKEQMRAYTLSHTMQ